jgi:starch phosphorylase
MMKSSMRNLCPIFNTHRMLEDYVDGFYVPASLLYQKMEPDRKQTAEAFAAWKQKVQSQWKEVRIQEVKLEDGRAEIPVGKAMPVQARVLLGRLGPEDVCVDLYYGPMDADGELIKALTEPMTTDGPPGEDGQVYRATVPFRESGRFGFALRVMPRHSLMAHPVDMGLVVWG